MLVDRGDARRARASNGSGATGLRDVTRRRAGGRVAGAPGCTVPRRRHAPAGRRSGRPRARPVGASGVAAVVATGATVDGVVAGSCRRPPTVFVAGDRGAGSGPGRDAGVVAHRGDDDRGLAVTPCGLPRRRVAGRGRRPAPRARAARRRQPRRQRRHGRRSTSSGGRVPSPQPRGAASRSRPRRGPSSRSRPWLPDEPAPAVHVTATGGVVSAVLSDQWIDGATPRGTDDSVPSAPPARSQVLAGLDIDGDASLRLRQPRPLGRGPRPGRGAHRHGPRASRPRCAPCGCPPERPSTSPSTCLRRPTVCG